MTGQSLWVAFGKVGGTGADRAGKRVNEENRGGCIGLSYRKIGVLLSVYFSDLTRRPVYIDKALFGCLSQFVNSPFCPSIYKCVYIIETSYFILLFKTIVHRISFSFNLAFP